MVDTHVHLDFTDDIGLWLERAKVNCVSKIICVGTSVEASRKCVEIAEKYSNKDSGRALRQAQGIARMTKNTGLQIYATVGIHAQDGKGDIEKYGSLGKCIEELEKILRFAQNDRGEGVHNDKVVVAVGECGFDIKSGRDQLPETRKFQQELFEAQIELAAELALPLVVHCRNAWEETFEVLTRFRGTSLKSKRNPELAQQGSTSNPVGVFHSWTGDWEAAQRALSLGFYISFSGIVTFKNAPNVHEVAKKMPPDRMLLETDSPFLAPEPIRGSKNEPKNVRIIAEFVAELRNLPKDLICDITSENAGRLFNF